MKDQTTKNQEPGTKDPEPGTDSSPFFDDESPRVYTVSSLTSEIKDLLEGRYEFVWVEGEITNVRAPSSGHYYMVLKDEEAQIRAVMFRPQRRYLKFTPEDGMKVIVQGRIGVYEPRGEYQIILDYLEPLGIGALALAFEELKRKLAGQGVFDREAKRALPFLPRRVAVITSPTGAAIRDFLKVLQRRFANIEVVLVPVRVQGEGASEEIVEALERVNRDLEADVIVLTRGGGSLEDLWAFNQENLALAIRASRIPVLSAVGHEIDVTISDLAADVRAPTPSAAAEILAVEREALVDRTKEIAERLQRAMRRRREQAADRMTSLAARLRDPRRRIADSWMRLDELTNRLVRVMEAALREGRMRLAAEARSLALHSPERLCSVRRDRLVFFRRSLIAAMRQGIKDRSAALFFEEGRLRNLNPRSILDRGYSIALKIPEERVIRSGAGLRAGDRIRVVLAKGELRCLVEEIEEGA